VTLRALLARTYHSLSIARGDMIHVTTLKIYFFCFRRAAQSVEHIQMHRARSLCRLGDAEVIDSYTPGKAALFESCRLSRRGAPPRRLLKRYTKAEPREDLRTLPYSALAGSDASFAEAQEAGLNDRRPLR